tara:strand:+ start:293 stop:592 length:300 start_codon:yes stop_codon:yes gene_type:complete
VKKSVKNKIKKIEDILESMKDDHVRYIFSYIVVGKTLNDLQSDVITNVSEDMASKALGIVTDSFLYPEEKLPFVNPEEEIDDKLRLFNMFNVDNKKPEA